LPNVSKSAALDLAATQKAAAILRKGGPNAYEKARRALIQESRDWWDEHVEEEEHPATAEGLAEFIRDSLEPICYRMARKPNLPRRSRRKPWAKGCKRTDWRS
jgi:enoyl-CoA hydratase/carnithine racemase